MKCSKCGFESPESFKFCCQCGAKLINKCPNCGSTFPSYGTFCPECGTRVLGESIDAGNASKIVACPAVWEFVVGSCRFKMIKVEGGTFTMGFTEENVYDASDCECPAHKVTLSDYYIGQTEVTQALWKAVMGINPSYYSKGDNLPVEQVSWDYCQTFIKELNRLLYNQLGGLRFALPTDAQWEFAARGGNKSKGYKYAGSNNIDDVAWYVKNSGKQTHPVALKQPNELGLYDMSGNVYEWCQDWYALYSSNAQTNPQGPGFGLGRVIRGCSLCDVAESCRVSIRGYSSLDSRCSNVGLRLCLIP